MHALSNAGRVAGLVGFAGSVGRWASRRPAYRLIGVALGSLSNGRPLSGRCAGQMNIHRRIPQRGRPPLVMVHGLTSRYAAVLFTLAFMAHGCPLLTRV